MRDIPPLTLLGMIGSPGVCGWQLESLFTQVMPLIVSPGLDPAGLQASVAGINTTSRILDCVWSSIQHLEYWTVSGHHLSVAGINTTSRTLDCVWSSLVSGCLYNCYVFHRYTRFMIKKYLLVMKQKHVLPVIWYI